ncbi:acyltransferase family protein [Kribbella sp. NPDC051770]|uniref:acyltransferase family protein n=1 Tax=Kribbella sp. NPDC051770 TaxID=3155413 RepID=UPI003447BB35
MSGLTSVTEGAALSHPRPELLGVTALRGLAGLAVVASTVGVWRGAPGYLQDLVEVTASVAAVFFFVLSAFVLTYNYPGLSYASGRRVLGRYAAARVARIVPLYLVVGLVVLLLGELNGSDWVRAVWSDQTWFVAALVLFYVAFPLLNRPLSFVLARLPSLSWPAPAFLVRIGVIGYPLFLLQTLVIHGFGPVHAGTLSNALLALCWIGLTVLIAEGAHRYVGVPARRAVLEIARRIDRRSPAR